MDMLCNKCSEPWNWFYIRDNVLKDDDLYNLMKVEGGYVRDYVDAYQTIGQDSTLTAAHDETARWQFNPGPTIAQCPACIGKDIKPDDNAKIMADLAHLYGDDIDGFMADMEDFGLDE